ncbi:Taurine catabolism dioxygenase TauD/TfdA [Moelleriella libera RCEF 2490]|uniref:Taurine catabolism dioxygenase TauD/TfdA n=1 Tax=Moelleriella libera RCEF 2490 TaxID=1081109 RepID=A0A166UV07_9HYPO|nr:Taurine catabolism dioxygenase TauD/TfdA [Moelleriella libera RCEF 2490]
MAMADDGQVLAAKRCPIESHCCVAAPSRVLGLPNGLPAVLVSPMAWTGGQFANESDYVLHLASSDLQETREALDHFKKLGLDGDLVSRANFPLPRLQRKLEEMRNDVHHGKGFGLVRGLNPENFSVEDLSTIYLGIQCYVANLQGRQDKKGNMMVHIVADDSTKMKATHHRHSTADITFHNEEAGDVVSWLTRSAASQGGRCIIASSYTVYNTLAATRPDLARALTRSDWPFALPTFHCRPILFHHDNKIIMNFGRAALLGSASHARPASLPQLNAQQREALDAVEHIARVTQFNFKTQPGDIHFINNLAILHRREGFVDGNLFTERRHLVRMRLRDETMGWAIPAQLQDEWDWAFDPRPQNRVWHLQPMPDGYFPLRSHAN